MWMAKRWLGCGCIPASLLMELYQSLVVNPVHEGSPTEKRVHVKRSLLCRPNGGLSPSLPRTLVCFASYTIINHFFQSAGLMVGFRHRCLSDIGVLCIIYHRQSLLPIDVDQYIQHCERQEALSPHR